MPAPDRKRRLTAFLVALAVLVATPLAVVAADAFTDVPDTNVFHNDIAWLAEAGVTKGCNPPDNTEFCPGDNVTREQMSAFMRRLAVYMDAEDGTPGQADHATTADSATTAGDAETLGGSGPEAYRSISAGANCDQTAPNVCDTGGTLATVDLTAPAAGVVTISYQISLVETNSGEGLIQAWANSDDECNWFLVPLDSLLGSFSTTGFSDLTGTQFHSISGTTNVAVPAGTSTFSVCSAILDGEAQYASITATWSPEGTSIAVASASEAMTFPEGFGSELAGQSVAGFDS